MLKNYLKIAFRQLWKNKFQSSIHIIGLTIGMAGCLLIGLFVWDELQFDTFHEDGDRIYRVYNERTDEMGTTLMAATPPTFAPTLARDFPEVEQSLRIMNVFGQKLFKLEEEQHLEEGGIFAGPDIFDFFHLPLTEGDPSAVLKEPNDVVITAPLAKKYFGNQKALGKTIIVDGTPARVTGVLADLSPNFHLDFTYLLSFETALALISEERINSWVWQQFHTYLKLKPNSDSKGLAAKLPAFAEKYAWPQTESRGFKYIPHLQALRDVHLHSSGFEWDIVRRGNIMHVRALSFIGLFLLMIAAINFINLSTARAEKRAREVGVRKVVGASRKQLILQYISEAVLISFVALIVAFQLTSFLLPYLNDFTNKSLQFSLIGNPMVSGLLCLGGLSIGFLAGSYPAFVLSAFRPVRVLRGTMNKTGKPTNWLRKSLVVVQFSISVLLIISAIIFYQQVDFLNNKDYGFNREQIMIFPMRGKMFNNTEDTKAQFLKINNVVSASAGFGFPGDIVSGDDIKVPKLEGKTLPANIFAIDHDYIETMGMEVIAGRSFSRDYSTDAAEAFVINETAARQFGFSSPEAAIDQRLDWDMWAYPDSVKQGRIIGVVRDFHYKSLHEKVGTAVLHIYPESYWKMALRIKSDNVDETLAMVEQTWDVFGTGYPIDYQFVDESFGQMYKAEEQLSNVLMIFTLLAIFIACMGLLGLVHFATEQRTKEIGIRKILGASVEHIVGLFATDFIKLVLIAILLASPLAWYLLNNWLQKFPYHIDISAFIFLIAGGGAIIIALLTVSIQSMKAALSKPVEALRRE